MWICFLYSEFHLNQNLVEGAFQFAFLDFVENIDQKKPQQL